MLNLEFLITHFNWRFQIDTAPPATTRTFGVAFDKHSLNEDYLPEKIKTQWRHDLMVVILQDLEKNQFSPCCHTLPDGYDIIYRLDVAEDVLKRVAQAPHWTFDLDNENTPALSEILRDAKVWISFPKRQTIHHLETCDNTSTTITTTIAKAAPAPSPVEESKSKSSFLPLGSPALSDSTLVSDGATPTLEGAIIKAEAPKPAPKEESNLRQYRGRLHPVLEPYAKHPRFTKAVQKALHYESTRKGLPQSAWPQYLRNVHGVYLCDGPSAHKHTKKALARPDLLHLLKCRSSGQPLPNHDQHAREFAKFGLLPRIEDWGTMDLMTRTHGVRY